MSSSRLDQINWQKTCSDLHYEILGCPIAAQKDLLKMWRNLQTIATEISKSEVVERRTMGSSGRSADEKLDELNKQIRYIQKMITIARLQFT